MTDEELIKNMKILHLDHAPDGWPSVRMSDISQLLDIIDRQAAALKSDAKLRIVEFTAKRCAAIVMENRFSITNSADAIFMAQEIRTEFDLSD